MTRGTVERQRAIGALGVKVAPEGLEAKLGVISKDVVPAGAGICSGEEVSA
jgi:hypothetical protein